MSDGGKGSASRPYSVDRQIFEHNWNKIFSKGTDMNDPNKPTGTCGCGRSPTGNCIGWHALTEEEYREQLAVYEDQQNKQQKAES